MRWILWSGLFFAGLRFTVREPSSPAAVVSVGALGFTILSGAVYFLAVFLPRRFGGIRENAVDSNNEL
jgi:hypothetical protein